MSESHIIRDAHRLLMGLENGSVNSADAYNIALDLDPVLLFWIFRFLRDKYPASNQSSQGVLSRLLDLTRTYPELVQKAKSGEDDMISEWFEETFATSDFYTDSLGMVTQLVEKLEG